MGGAGGGGLLAEGLVGAASGSAQGARRARPPVNELRLLGEKGAVHADLFHGFSYVEESSTSRAAKVARPFRVALRQGVAAAANLVRRASGGEPAYPGLRELLRRFYAALGGGSAAPISPTEILTVAEVWERLGAAVQA